MPESTADLRERRVRLAGVGGSLLVTGRANVRYLTGFSGSNGWALWHRDAMHLLTDSRYALQAEGECCTADVLVAPASLTAALADLIGDSVIGVEADHLTLKEMAELRRDCPKARFEETAGRVERLRLRKSAGEIARIRAALAVAEAAGREALQENLEGRTEASLAADLDHRARLAGASEAAFPTIVAAAERGALPHARPTRAPVEPGTVVQLDWGCRVDGYCSDISRVVAVSPRRERWSKIRDAVEEALLAACDAIRPGRPTAEIDGVARMRLQRHGLAGYFTHGLGHGVGLEVHESPRLSARSKEVLEEGMVVTVEPGVYVPGEGGIRLENMVVVREEGCEVLNTLPLTWGGWRQPGD